MKFFDMLVTMEGDLFKDGYYKAFAILAGPCPLCKECGKVQGTSCRFPAKARPSMEACGIDVFQTARNSGFFIQTLREKTETQNLYCLILVDWHLSSSDWIRACQKFAEFNGRSLFRVGNARNLRKELQPAAYVGWGIVSANRGNFDQAITGYKRIIEVASGFVAAYTNWGLANYNLGRYDQALHDFDTVIGLEPNKTRTYVYRGLANYNLGKYDQAIEDHDKATKLDPKEAKAYYNLARIYSLKDNHEKALHDLDAAIKIGQGFKSMAKKENEFDRIRELPEFIKLIGS